MVNQRLFIILVLYTVMLKKKLFSTWIMIFLDNDTVRHFCIELVRHFI